MHHFSDNELSPYIGTYMRYARDNICSVQHEQQYYNRPPRKKAMALSMFEMSKLLQPEQLCEAESISILHTHSATQEKFSSVNGEKFILVFLIACLWTLA